jgi:hypothetical protein
VLRCEEPAETRPADHADRATNATARAGVQRRGPVVSVAAASASDGVLTRSAAIARTDRLGAQLARTVATRQGLELAPPADVAAGATLARETAAEAAAPHAKKQVSGWARWGVGSLQLLGGALEVVGGGAAVLVPEPSMITKVGGVLLIGHGTDTFTSGIGTLWSGEISETYTARGSAAGAESLGASAETAHWIGVSVDVAAGVGASVATTIGRRIVIAGAEQAGSTLTLGYLHRGAAEMGHNIVGVSDANGFTRYFHLVGAPGEKVAFIPMRATADELVAKGYELTRIPISAEGAKAGMAATSRMSLLLPRSGMRGSNPLWSMVGPNCTTAATQVLEAGGASVPAFARSPLLLHLGVNYGWGPIAGIGSAYAGTTAGVESDPHIK